MVRQIILADSPELLILLEDFQTSLNLAQKKLLPLLEKAKAKEIPSSPQLQYVEMKFNLLMSYCTYLAFYLLLKVESKSVKGHPVVFKLAHIKALLDKLRPIDDRLETRLNKMFSKLDQDVV